MFSWAISHLFWALLALLTLMHEGGELLLTSFTTFTSLLLLNTQIPSSICPDLLFWSLPHSSGEGCRNQTHHCGMHTLSPGYQGNMQHGEARHVCSPCSMPAWLWSERRSWSCDSCGRMLCSPSPTRLCTCKAFLRTRSVQCIDIRCWKLCWI